MCPVRAEFMALCGKTSWFTARSERQRARQSNPGSRAAVLRRSEGDSFSSPSDNDDGGFPARSAPAMFAPPICRRSRRNASRTELILRHKRFVGSDEDGGSPANIAASEASH
jgi:hypothetical protein